MTGEQFWEWRKNPTTELIFEEIEGRRQGLIDCLIAGQSLSDSADETQKKTALMVGNIEGLNQILNITYEDEKPEEGETTSNDIQE